MNCNILQQGQLVDYLAGTLDETARQEVERHLAVCARCKAEAESMGATVSALRNGLAARRETAPRLDAVRRRDILNARRAKRPGVTRASSWWVRSQPLLNVAAILVLTFVCVGLLMPAMSVSRGRMKQTSISAARAKEAQRQLEVELVEAEAKDQSVMLVSAPPVASPESGAKAEGMALGDDTRVAAESGPGDAAKPTLSFKSHRSSGARKSALAAYGGSPATVAPARKESREEVGERLDEVQPAVVEVAKAPVAEKKHLRGRADGEIKSKAAAVAAMQPATDALEMKVDSVGGLLVAAEPAPDVPMVANGYLARSGAGTAAVPKPSSRLTPEERAGDSKPSDMIADRADGHEDVDNRPMEEPVPVYGQEVETANNPFSTFSIDADTASFTRSRQFLASGKLPPAGAVRVEEFVNAFEYDYPSPDRRAFAVYADRSRSPFRSPLELLRIGVRGRVIGRDRQKQSVLTLVVDASGSMSTPDRMDLVKASVRLLVDSMAPEDRMSVVTFGSETRLVLDDVRVADKKTILSALDRIRTSGSTQLEGGIRLGYETAARHFRAGAVNRVLLLSDGVANLGAATAQEILAQVEQYRRQGIYCSVFGFGRGPYNDAMLETLADKGDGVYRFVDSLAEARRVFVEDLAANLHVIARDVKIQVEFDPRRVKTYRQLGYENRALTREQFRDDTVDAGEVGSGQSVTALYEIRVQGPAAEPLGMVRVRWMDPEAGKVEELEQPLRASDRYGEFEAAPARFRLAAAVAAFADHLRGHPLASGTDLNDVERVVRAVSLELPLDQRVADLVRMVAQARNLMK